VPDAKGRFTHRIRSKDTVSLDLPILIDAVFRAEQSDDSLSIGTVRQSVWYLTADQVGGALALLSSQAPAAVAKLKLLT
jgi:hypothetical protein